MQDRAGNLWVANENLGLFQVTPERKVQQIPWVKLGHQDHASVLAADPLKSGLWIGFFLGGVAYFSDGEVRRSYGAADGLGAGRVSDFRVEQDGTVWISTEGGLSRLKDGRVVTLTGKNGLPCDTIHGVMGEDSDSFWLYTVCGLVRVARSELALVADAIDKDKNTKQEIRATVFDSSDGVRVLAGTGHYSPQFAKTSDGKLWFLPWDGVSVLDPRHLPFNPIPPPVHIEQVTGDRKTYDAASVANGQMRLPPLIRDLEIDYTALSFVAPEKVRFRYKLEGRDSDWQDVGNRRQAFYSDLPPGNYRFRVSASNNSGVWNEAGTFLDLFLHRPGILSDHMVPFLGRGRVSRLARSALSTAAVASGAAIQHQSGRTRPGEDTHRSGFARYPAAEFSGSLVALSHGDVPAAGSSRRSPQYAGECHRTGPAGDHRRTGCGAGVALSPRY